MAGSLVLSCPVKPSSIKVFSSYVPYSSAHYESAATLLSSFRFRCERVDSKGTAFRRRLLCLLGIFAITVYRTIGAPDISDSERTGN